MGSPPEGGHFPRRNRNHQRSFDRSGRRSGPSRERFPDHRRVCLGAGERGLCGSGKCGSRGQPRHQSIDQRRGEAGGVERGYSGGDIAPMEKGRRRRPRKQRLRVVISREGRRSLYELLGETPYTSTRSSGRAELDPGKSLEPPFESGIERADSQWPGKCFSKKM